MKGILLAGGSGRRLHPLTAVTSKHLLPIYNKPMIYYPLSVLMLARVRDILIISTPEHRPLFEALMGDGAQWGLRLSYATQGAPRGIADAVLVGEKFIDGDDVALILGDNILHRDGLQVLLHRAQERIERDRGALLFAYPVADPADYGVIEFDDRGRVLSLEEKPVCPRSNYATVGLSFYDDRAVEFAKRLKPSARGELELTDLNRLYLEAGALHVEKLGRGATWLDMGTPERLLEAANFVHVLEKRQGLLLADPDEIARTLRAEVSP